MKFNGEQHAPLTPGEYTQLTGRAGRRGIDVEGHAVVLWHPDIEPAEVAGLASTRTFPLRSSFAPSYNMTINLVQQMGPAQARALLERSFAQYQADRSVVGLVRGTERGEKLLDEIAAELGGRDGDDARLHAAAREDRRTGTRTSPLVAAAATPGRQRRAGRRCAAATSSRSSTVGAAAWPWCSSPTATTTIRGRWCSPSTGGRAGSRRRTTPVRRARWGRCRCRSGSNTASPGCAGTSASALRSAAAGLAIPNAKGKRGSGSDPDTDPELVLLREQLRRHPAHGLPDREARARVGRALSAGGTRQRPTAPEDRGGHQLAGAHVRPDRRVAVRTRLHIGRRQGREGDGRRPVAGPDLQRK